MKGMGEVENEDRKKTMIRIVWVCILLSLGYTAAIIAISPRKYRSHTLVEVVVPPAEVGEKAMATTMVQLQSEDVFDELLEELDLRNRWEMSSDDIKITLENTVEIQRIDDSNRLEIRVRHPNQQDVVDVANAIPAAYLRVRNKNHQVTQRDIMKALDEVILGKSDLLSEELQLLQVRARELGAPTVESNLNANGFQMFLKTLPEGEKRREADKLLRFEEAIDLYEANLNSLKDSRLERELAANDSHGSMLSIKALGEASEAEVVWPDFWLKTLEAIAKGAVLGGVLVLLVRHFRWKKGTGGLEKKSRKERVPDPADVW